MLVSATVLVQNLNNTQRPYYAHVYVILSISHITYPHGHDRNATKPTHLIIPHTYVQTPIINPFSQNTKSATTVPTPATLHPPFPPPPSPASFSFATDP